MVCLEKIASSRFAMTQKRNGKVKCRGALQAAVAGCMDSSQKTIVRSTFRSASKPIYTYVVEFAFVFHSKVYCSRLCLK